MTNEHTIILEKIKTYLDQHPTQRFGQAIFNLGINEFKQNPVRQLIVHNPEDYVFSSAIDYADGKGLVTITKV